MSLTSQMMVAIVVSTEIMCIYIVFPQFSILRFTYYSRVELEKFAAVYKRQIKMESYHYLHKESCIVTGLTC